MINRVLVVLYRVGAIPGEQCTASKAVGCTNRPGGFPGQLSALPHTMRRVNVSSRDEPSLPSPGLARKDSRQGLRMSRGRTYSDDGLREVHTRSTKRGRIFPKKPLARVLIIVGLVVVILVIRWILSDFLLLVNFKLANNLDTSGWRTSLRLRKPPLLFVHSTTSVAVVFEANHLAGDGNHHLAIRWRKETDTDSTEAEVKTERPEGENGWRRWIHSTVLEGLEAGASYTYEVYLAPSKAKKSSKKAKVLARRTFTWTGQEAAPDFTPDAKTASPSIIHIACVGDNQFRLAIFARILSSLARLRSYVPSYGSAYAPRQIVQSGRQPVTPKQPQLLLHVGDAVQGPHDLDQWQTDFWDPLTRGYAPTSFSGTIPLLYARGNHDFDEDGKNLYTAGLPRIQKGELNRTATRALPRWQGFAVPATADGDQRFAMHESAPRDPGDRSTYFSYSPHPRCRVLVLDSNLRESRTVPGPDVDANAPSEVEEQERWLVWEMGRSEWKDASFRIIMVHIPPFVERWEKKAWEDRGESKWSAPSCFASSALFSRLIWRFLGRCGCEHD